MFVEKVRYVQDCGAHTSRVKKMIYNNHLMPPFKRERESEEEEKYISNGMRSFIFEKNNTRLQSTVAQTIVGGVVDDQKNSESSNLALNTNQRTCVCTHLWHNSVDFYTMLTDFQMPIAKKCFAIKLPIQNFPGKEKCLTNDRRGDLPAVILHRPRCWGNFFFQPLLNIIQTR
jgi:hypothetical protein